MTKPPTKKPKSGKKKVQEVDDLDEDTWEGIQDGPALKTQAQYVSNYIRALCICLTEPKGII